MKNTKNTILKNKICSMCLVKSIVISSVIYFVILSSLLYFFSPSEKSNDNTELSYQGCYGNIYAFVEKESTSLCIKNPFSALVSRPILKKEINTIVITDLNNMSFPVSKAYCSAAKPITGNENMVSTIIYNELNYNITSWLCSVG